MISFSIPDFDPALILPPLEWPEFCGACLRTCSMATMAIWDGLYVECTGCGDKRRVRFTRERS
jgi:hypothetical protein